MSSLPQMVGRHEDYCIGFCSKQQNNLCALLLTLTYSWHLPSARSHPSTWLACCAWSTWPYKEICEELTSDNPESRKKTMHHMHSNIKEQTPCLCLPKLFYMCLASTLLLPSLQLILKRIISDSMFYVIFPLSWQPNYIIFHHPVYIVTHQLYHVLFYTFQYKTQVYHLLLLLH